MALIRWLGDRRENDIWRRMDRMQREFNQAWSHARPSATVSPSVFPPINIYDDGESIIVRAELPGVDPEDLDISVSGDTLTLRGKRELAAADEECCYQRRERASGEFRRSFTLPTQVDNSKVVATSKNGILEIRLPRAEQSKLRKIEVATS